MNFVKLFFLSLVVVLIATSCAKDSGMYSGRNDVFALYKLVYDASTYSSTATAEFFDGGEAGNKLDLGFSVKATVLFADKESSYKPSTLTFYREFPNKLTKVKVTYQYTEKTLELVNTVQLPKDISVPNSLTTIDKNAGVSFSFGGDAVAQDETVTLTIGNLKFKNTVIGSKTFALTPTDLSSLAAGNTTVRIEREKRTEASQATPTGGILIGVNRSAIKTVTVL